MPCSPVEKKCKIGSNLGLIVLQDVLVSLVPHLCRLTHQKSKINGVGGKNYSWLIDEAHFFKKKKAIQILSQDFLIKHLLKLNFIAFYSY